MEKQSINPKTQEFPQYSDLTEAINAFRSKNLKLLASLELYSAIPQYSVPGPISETLTTQYAAITSNSTGGFNGKLE